MSIVTTAKAMPRYGLMPLTNMWWPQTMMLRRADRDHGVHHRLVAEDGLAREGRR